MERPKCRWRVVIPLVRGQRGNLFNYKYCGSDEFGCTIDMYAYSTEFWACFSGIVILRPSAAGADFGQARDDESRHGKLLPFCISVLYNAIGEGSCEGTVIDAADVEIHQAPSSEIDQLAQP